MDVFSVLGTKGLKTFVKSFNGRRSPLKSLQSIKLYLEIYQKHKMKYYIIHKIETLTKSYQRLISWTIIEIRRKGGTYEFVLATSTFKTV